MPARTEPNAAHRFKILKSNVKQHVCVDLSVVRQIECLFSADEKMLLHDES